MPRRPVFCCTGAHTNLHGVARSMHCTQTVQMESIQMRSSCARSGAINYVLVQSQQFADGQVVSEKHVALAMCVCGKPNMTTLGLRSITGNPEQVTLLTHNSQRKVIVIVIADCQDEYTHLVNMNPSLPQAPQKVSRHGFECVIARKGAGVFTLSSHTLLAVRPRLFKQPLQHTRVASDTLQLLLLC